MSRTLHHVRYKHWNVKVPRLTTVYRWGIGGVGLDYEDEVIGVELYDLRFYAGCKRQPQLVHRSREECSYVRTWGHAGGAAHGIAKEIAGAKRAEWRDYALDVTKAHRAGSDLEGLLEPEGRTRHQALWEAW